MAKEIGARNIGEVTKSGNKIADVRAAGEDHQVITVVGKGGGYMRKPCPTCPWRVDATGEFPAQAFKHSAATSYDMSINSFACHQSGADKTKTCAGFLLRGADNNLAVRLQISDRKIDMREVSDGGVQLHASYREMAVANGVDPEDEVLKLCRP